MWLASQPLKLPTLGIRGCNQVNFIYSDRTFDYFFFKLGLACLCQMAAWTKCVILKPLKKASYLQTRYRWGRLETALRFVRRGIYELQ
jgi:hypothetical protein